MSASLRDVLESGEFAVTCECIPGRGASEEAVERSLGDARAIWAGGRVHAISLCDNPGGNPALLADAAAVELARDGVECLVHFSAKDRSRDQVLAQLYAMERAGLHNVLCMTGDYPQSGWEGLSRPVFDLDSVQLVALAHAMNEGLEVDAHGRTACEKPCSFLVGAVVNPFKYRAGELYPQYLKLEKKICAGAEFVVSQLGYDARKMEELVRYVREHGYNTPLLANVFVANRFVAGLMRNGTIAGAHVSDAFLTALDAESALPDKGAAVGVERAASQVALARELGYVGVHLGGFGVDAAGVAAILERAAELAGDVRPLAVALDFGEKSGCYLYPCGQDGAAHDAACAAHDTCGEGEKSAGAKGEVPAGLPVRDAAPLADDVAGRKLFKRWRISRFFHALMLTRDKGLYGLLARRMDKKEKKHGRAFSHSVEHGMKAAIYGCKDCGDCGLETCLFSCPMASCPKNQRNGPCGGSDDGFCEVEGRKTGRYCIWYLAWHRARAAGTEKLLSSFITPPNDWALRNTSAWSNYTHDRDANAHRLPVSIGDARTGDSRRA